MVQKSSGQRPWFLIGLLLSSFCVSILFAQNPDRPIWYDEHDPESGMVSGYGTSPDLTTAVVTALGEMGRQLGAKIDVISNETAEGTTEISRQTTSKKFRSVTLIDTLIFRTHPDGEEDIYQQTEVTLRKSQKAFRVLQTVTVVREKEHITTEISSTTYSINDVLKELKSAGIDIKKQVVPTEAGYQYYLRLQTGGP